jgi:uncharacterized protein (DUF58 family)
MFRRTRYSIDPNNDNQFSDAWVLLAIVLTLIGLALNNVVLTTAAVLLLIISGASWLWAELSLRGLTYHRRFSEHRAFQGETVELSLEIRNTKLLPQPWVTVHDSFPHILPVTEVKLALNPATNLADFRTFWMVGPYQRITRRFHIHCTERGYHLYGPAIVTTGDAFGFFTPSKRQQDADHLIIYPRIYTVAEMRLPTKHPFGPAVTPNSLYQDPLRTAGVRPWEAGDSLRRIHWKASARQQELLSRIYEPSEEHVIQIFLNSTTMTRHWHGYIPELQERAISVAGSIAALATAERMPVGLIANGALRGSERALRLLPGRSPSQLMHILELLAQVTPFATQPIEELLVDQAPHLPWGATIVLVTAVAHEELLVTLLDLAAAGRRIVLFTLAEEPPNQFMGNVTVYHLPHLVDDLIIPLEITPHGSTPSGSLPGEVSPTKHSVITKTPAATLPTIGRAP